MKSSSQRMQTAEGRRSSWHGTAFIVEAMLLLAFLVGAIAVFMHLFADASAKGAENEDLSNAIVLAANSAERFASDPEGMAPETETDGFRVTCLVTPEETDGGTLYHADIAVLRGEEEVYRLTTARYVSGVAR
ncbi:hypothetical protein [Raoultibacter phocaeensis]|uniref:hypothetical protein n=1 Tax=Raoultibacter phocaeensis TaxID=2479841 RepID=UPI001118A0D8|nr:hypothetical protein [Raoultibacter phocaeensis]